MKKIRDTTAFTVVDCKDLCEYDWTCAIFSYNMKTKTCSLFHSITVTEYDAEFVPQLNTVFYYYVRFDSIMKKLDIKLVI